MKHSRFTANMLAEAGVMIALAKILEMIKLYQMPAGGSITLGSMAPLFFFALRWGWQRGMLVGLVYGLVDFIIGGYVVHPLQLLLDYPLAYLMCGLAGIRTLSSHHRFVEFLPGLFLATLARFACHVLSGCIFFSNIDFTQPGASLLDALQLSQLSSGLLYSVTYNSFLFVDLLLCLVLMALLWKPLQPTLLKQND